MPLRPIHLEDDLGIEMELFHDVDERDGLILKLVVIPVTIPVLPVFEEPDPRRLR